MEAKRIFLAESSAMAGVVEFKQKMGTGLAQKVIQRRIGLGKAEGKTQLY